MKKIIAPLLLIPLIAYALPEDRTQPIRLSADRATYSERTGVTTYSGNVIITQGTLKIKADNLTVQLNNDKSISSVIATGGLASFEQVISAEKGLAKGQAQKINYNASTGIVTLTGKARLTQADSSFSGNNIRYSLGLGDVEAVSGNGQRVELVIPPNSQFTQEAIRP